MFPNRHSAPRRACFAALAASVGLALALAFAPSGGHAQEIAFHRIGTGAIGGTYFAIGGMLANAISNPPGSRPCEKGGSCGVPGLVAVAQSTQGSVENVRAIAEGRIESALVQADVAYWAYHGTGLFQDGGQITQLRAIANLFPSTVHIVARGDKFIGGVGDLRGLRVSLGEEGSGTLVNARTILSAYGLSEAEIQPFHLKPGPASDMLHDGEIDAFFVVGGLPVTTIADLAQRLPIQLVPISGTEGEELKSFYPFFSEAIIDAGTYQGIGRTASVAISTQWITSAEAEEEFMHELAKALWHERSRAIFDDGHPEGERIRLETALERIAMPLHPGAARYYQERGMKR